MVKALDNLRAGFGLPSKGLSLPAGIGGRWNPPDGDPFLSPYFTTYSANSPDLMAADWDTMVRDAYKANGIVFACIVARMSAFAEARFQWRTFNNGRPSDLFGSTELALIEHPWPSGTTGELLGRMEQDASLAGNFYATTVDDSGKVGKAATGAGRRIARLRPNWVELIIGSASGDPFDLDARVVGFRYTQPKSAQNPYGKKTLLLADEVCHYSPIPDPEASFRGMSWITPIVREVQADKSATLHKLKFFENGATPNLAVKFPIEIEREDFDYFVQAFKAGHQGVNNAYKTLFAGGGADPVALGKDFQQLDFKATQGAGETRIAAAAGVPPVWAGFSEGLQGSSLNAGNFGQARRRFADATIRPNWRMASASLQVLVPYPTNPAASLWYDDRDVAFLREDRKDVVEIQQIEALTIRQLIDAGYEPDAVIRAVQANDWSILASAHTGLFSVQLQAPVDPNATPADPNATPAGSTDGP